MSLSLVTSHHATLTDIVSIALFTSIVVISCLRMLLKSGCHTFGLNLFIFDDPRNLHCATLVQVIHYEWQTGIYHLNDLVVFEQSESQRYG